SRSSGGYLLDEPPDMTPSFPRTGVSGHAGAVHAEEIMEILEAYDLTGSLRDARSWWGACITRSRVCGRAGARCELVE
ncbi:hypothetical protein, partial [Mycobacterium tuberculosis]